MNSYGTNEMTRIDDSPVDLETPYPLTANYNSQIWPPDFGSSTPTITMNAVENSDFLFLSTANAVSEKMKNLEQNNSELAETVRQQNKILMSLQKAMEELRITVSEKMENSEQNNSELAETVRQQNKILMSLQKAMEELRITVSTGANDSNSTNAQPSEIIPNNRHNPEDSIDRVFPRNSIESIDPTDDSIAEPQQNNTEMNATRSDTEPETIPLGQYCTDFNLGTSRQTSASTNEVNHDRPPTSSNQQALPSKVPQGKAVKSKRCKSKSAVIAAADLSRTTNANVFVKWPDGSYHISLPHLWENPNSEKGRPTAITNCHGQPPVLTVDRDQLPLEGFMRMALVSTSALGSYSSVYQLQGAEKNYYGRISRPFTPDGTNPQKIPIKELIFHKRCDHELYNTKNKQQPGKDVTYTITTFPSGKKFDTPPGKTLKELNTRYNIRAPDLVISFSPNVRISDQLVSCPKQCNEETSSDNSIENISRHNLVPGVIYFDIYNECSMSFLLGILENTNYGLTPGYIWLEISLITNENYSVIYHFVTENGEKTQFYNIPITKSNSEISLNIRKLTLMEIRNNSQLCQVLYGHQNLGQANHEVHPYIDDDAIRAQLAASGKDHFSVQLRVLSGGKNPNRTSAVDHPSLKPWIAAEFIEGYKTSSGSELVPTPNSVNDCQQHQTSKRSSNECSFSLGLPVVKCSRSN